jgi:hypothetical protein
MKIEGVERVLQCHATYLVGIASVGGPLQDFSSFAPKGIDKLEYEFYFCG